MVSLYRVHKVHARMDGRTHAGTELQQRYMYYCKRANIRGGFYFAMFAVDDFSAKLKPPRSFNNTSVFSNLLITLVLKFEICEIKTSAKGPHRENREILTPRN